MFSMLQCTVNRGDTTSGSAIMSPANGRSSSGSASHTYTTLGVKNAVISCLDFMTPSLTGSSVSPIMVTSSGTCPTITFNPTTVPNGTVGTSYAFPIGNVGGMLPYMYSITSGTLPPGLSYSMSSIIGTPTMAGIYNFTATATDTNSCS